MMPINSGLTFVLLFFSVVSGSRAAVLQRRGKDCGSWTIWCQGNTNKDDAPWASAACNNACYYLNCMEGITFKETTWKDQKILTTGWQATYAGPGHDARKESGCTIGAGEENVGTVCNSMPFSQQFNDFQDQTSWAKHEPKVIANPSNTGEKDRSCDEFPMNEMLLPAFKDRAQLPGKSKIRASLRCMPHELNQAGGTQLSVFVSKGSGTAYPQPNRNVDDCPPQNAMAAGDKFKVEFAQVDTAYMPYCGIASNDAERAKICQEQNDGQQYYMTYKAEPNGNINMPYQVGSDNRYARHNGHTGQINQPQELQQCIVQVTRNINTTPQGQKSGLYLEAQVYRSVNSDIEKFGNFKGFKKVAETEADKCPVQPNTWTLQAGTGLDQDLVISLPPSTSSAQHLSPQIEFKYGSATSKFTPFIWNSGTEGSSPFMSAALKKIDKTANADAKDYHYCYGTTAKANQPEEVQRLNSNKVENEQVTCFFPCFNPASGS